MTISDNTVAIIGTGNIGSRLAANFAAGDQDFLLVRRRMPDPGDPTARAVQADRVVRVVLRVIVPG